MEQADIVVAATPDATEQAAGSPSAAAIARTPSRIILTPGPSTVTSQRVSWTLRTATAGQTVQFRQAGSTVVRSVAAVRRGATTKKESGTAAPRYTALMSGLAGGATYSYRIVTKHGASGWRSFRTASATARGVTLIGLGDTQVDNRGIPQRTIAAALRKAPGTAALLHAGDVVNKPNRDGEWADWFHAMGSAGGSRNWLVAIGNHELCILTTCTSGEGQAFRSYFTRPGGAQSKATWFTTDYPGVRVVVLDSFGGRIAAQAAYLDRALATNPNEFSIVLMHAPPFASRPGRTNAFLKPIQAVIERHDVDLVLTGHDHSYARGYRSANGTVWATSVSGGKYYPASRADWTRNGATRKVAATETATYQIISVQGDRLVYTAIVSAKGKKSSTKVAVGGVLDRLIIDKSSGTKVVR